MRLPAREELRLPPRLALQRVRLGGDTRGQRRQEQLRAGARVGKIAELVLRRGGDEVGGGERVALELAVGELVDELHVDQREHRGLGQELRVVREREHVNKRKRRRRPALDVGLRHNVDDDLAGAQDAPHLRDGPA